MLFWNHWNQELVERVYFNITREKPTHMPDTPHVQLLSCKLEWTNQKHFYFFSWNQSETILLQGSPELVISLLDMRRRAVSQDWPWIILCSLKHMPILAKYHMIDFRQIHWLRGKIPLHVVHSRPQSPLFPRLVMWSWNKGLWKQPLPFWHLAMHVQKLQISLLMLIMDFCPFLSSLQRVSSFVLFWKYRLHSTRIHW